MGQDCRTRLPLGALEDLRLRNPCCSRGSGSLATRSSLWRKPDSYVSPSIPDSPTAGPRPLAAAPPPGNQAGTNTTQVRRGWTSPNPPGTSLIGQPDTGCSAPAAEKRSHWLSSRAGQAAPPLTGLLAPLLLHERRDPTRASRSLGTDLRSNWAFCLPGWVLLFFLTEYHLTAISDSPSVLSLPASPLLRRPCASDVVTQSGWT